MAAALADVRASIDDALTSLPEPLRSELLALDADTAQAVYRHAAGRLRGIARVEGIDAVYASAHRIALSCLNAAIGDPRA